MPEPKHCIKLDDLVKRELRVAQERLGDAKFYVQQSSISAEDFATRLKNYEEAVGDLLRVTILLGQWADEQQQVHGRNIVEQLAGNIEVSGGAVLGLSLRFYPMLLAMYAGGIAAIDAGNYRSLQSLFATQVGHPRRGNQTTVLEATTDAMLDANRLDAFKALPEFRKKRKPQSEYRFMRMQPIVEDVLGLGNRYERVFDRFESLYALSYADLGDRRWGHPGRFAWKYVEPCYAGNPFKDLVDEAKRDGDKWPPLQAGKFRASHARFAEVAERIKVSLLEKLPWH